MSMSDETIKKTITLVRATQGGRGAEPCKVKLEIELRRKETCAPHLSIDLEECLRCTELSICALVWYTGDRANDPSSAGQCVDVVREYFGGHEVEFPNTSRPPDLDSCSINELCDLWERWHLNAMIAGSRAQRDHLEANPPQEPFYPVSYYEKACEILKAANLYEDRGYKYGSAWLSEPLPVAVMARIGEICRAFEAK